MKSLMVTYYVVYFSAICKKRCQNGGECVAPGTCSCPRYYTGPQCSTGMLRKILFSLECP